MSKLKALYEGKVTGPMDVGSIKTWFLGKLNLTLSVEDYAETLVWIQPYWMSDRKRFSLMLSRRNQEGNHTLVSAIVRTILPVEPVILLLFTWDPALFTQAYENLIFSSWRISLILATRPKSHKKGSADRLKCATSADWVQNSSVVSYDTQSCRDCQAKEDALRQSLYLVKEKIKQK